MRRNVVDTSVSSKLEDYDRCLIMLIRYEQVGDLNIWNQHDPRERFWAARTRQLQGSHMVEGDRLWSNLPFMRPLCGIIKDGCLLQDGPGNGRNGGREESSDERGALTKFGGRCHDLLGTRCDPYGNIVPTITYSDYVP
jgi:uncharacterized protein YcgI (DUF1989 family)